MANSSPLICFKHVSCKTEKTTSLKKCSWLWEWKLSCINLLCRTTHWSGIFFTVVLSLLEAFPGCGKKMTKCGMWKSESSSRMNKNKDWLMLEKPVKWNELWVWSEEDKMKGQIYAVAWVSVLLSACTPYSGSTSTLCTGRWVTCKQNASKSLQGYALE